MSRRIAIVLLLSVIGLDASARAQDSKVQGDWLIVSAIDDGEDTKEPVGDKVTFTKTKMIVQPKDDSEEAPPPFPIVMDLTKTPWQIDITFKRDDTAVVAKGLMAIEDGMLKLCFAFPGMPRPATLTSEKETQQMSMVFKRLGDDSE